MASLEVDVLKGGNISEGGASHEWQEVTLPPDSGNGDILHTDNSNVDQLEADIADVLGDMDDLLKEATMDNNNTQNSYLVDVDGNSEGAL